MKKQSRKLKEKQKLERYIQRDSLKNCFDMRNMNDRSHQDEDSIKDYINDEARKKQSNVNSVFTTRLIQKKRKRSLCIRKTSNQALLQATTSESISSIQKKKPMSSNHTTKR